MWATAASFWLNVKYLYYFDEILANNRAHGFWELSAPAPAHHFEPALVTAPAQLPAPIF